MPLQIVGQDPFGVMVQKDDGSTVQIPHDLAQQMLGPMLAQNGPAPDAAPPDRLADVDPGAPDGSLPPGLAQAMGQDALAKGLPPPNMYGAWSRSGPGEPWVQQGQDYADAEAEKAKPQAQKVAEYQAQVRDEEAAAQRDREAAGIAPMAQPPTPQAPPVASATPQAQPARAAGGGARPMDVGQQLAQAGKDASDAAIAAGNAKAQGIEAAGPLREQAIKQAQAADVLSGIELKQRMAEADARSRDLANQVQQLAQTRIDPNAVFGDMSTGGKIMTFAALLAGGAIGARTGKNEALETVNNMVNRSIQAQVAQLQNKREAIGEQRTILAQDVARGMDLYSASVKAHAVALEQAAQLIDAQGAKFAGATERATASQTAAQLRLGAQKDLADYQAHMASVAAQNYATSSANMRAKNELAANSALDIMKSQLGYTEHLATNQTALQKEQMAAAAKMTEEQRKLTVMGPRFTPGGGAAQMTVGVANDEKSANAATELGAKTSGAQSALQAYERSVEQYRGSRGGPAATQGYQIMEQKYADAKSALFELKYGSKPNKDELDQFLDPELPPPQGLLNFADPYAKLRETQQSVVDRYNSRIANYVRNPVYLPPVDRGGAAQPALGTKVGQPELPFGSVTGKPTWMPEDVWNRIQAGR